MKYKRRNLWPEFEEDKPREEEVDFVRTLVQGLGVPVEYADKATIKSFSDGSVSLKLNIDLTESDVQQLCSQVK